MEKFVIFDGHNDVLLVLFMPWPGTERSFFERSERGHLDLPRAREGGFGGGFFAIFVPSPRKEAEASASNMTVTENGYTIRMAEPVGHAQARQVAAGMIDLLFRLERESQGQMRVVRTADEVQHCLDNDVLAAVLHFEGAEAIDPELNLLADYYDRGLRSLGIVWSRPNIFAHGVPFGYPHSPDTGPGLTPIGHQLVRDCNRLGILLDLSHLNEQGFWDVARLSDAPLVATHSNAHAITPTTRNLTDKQLDAIRESDGMVGLNFGVGDLRPDGQRDPDMPIAFMVQHIDYLVERMGIEHVGFGSDFDGTRISREIGDATGLPKLIAALQARGYDEPALNKITHENWLRVLRKTWKS